nr:GNAT family protein [Brevibacillus thermoruber]
MEECERRVNPFQNHTFSNMHNFAVVGRKTGGFPCTIRTTPLHPCGFSRETGNANIRIAITSREHQGRGLGTEAMRLLLDYGFGILNLHRIELNVFSYNARAIRAYEKLGFQREGVQREALYYNHQYHDSIIMSILEDEYRAKHVKKHV